MAIKDEARKRAARLAGRGFPLKDKERLLPFTAFGESVQTGTIGPFLKGERLGELVKRVKDMEEPTGGEFAAVDAATARRKRERRSRGGK